MQDPGDTESQLVRAARLDEIYRVTHYKGVRTDKAGHTGFVDIEVWESGPNSPTGSMFHVNAKDGFRRGASGNGDESLQVAIQIVHWGDLDVEPHGDPDED